MKKVNLILLLTLLMSMVGAKVFAYDAKVDGIYYNFLGTNAEVTYYDIDDNEDAYTDSVVIPQTVTYNGTTYSVTSIGDNAFDRCHRLTSVTIPNSVTSIGYRAFLRCSGLTSVTFGNLVTSIGERAFQGCSGLTSVTIPNSVTSIGSYAFLNCSGLTSVTIPNSVTSISNATFSYCYSLTSLTIGNSVTSIGESAFNGCHRLTSVTIPNSVTSIGESAFYECSGLTSVTIPNSVTSIGESAFYECSGLTSVTIPNSVTNIGGWVFGWCSGLTSVTIPNSVTSIGECAFHYCSGLTSVTIPNSVEYIGGQAFYGCSDLTSVIIPNSVEYIGDKAFYGCSGLTNVEIHCCPSYGSYVFPNNIREVTFDCEIVTPMFKELSSIEIVTLTESVTSIKDNAFYGCKNLATLEIGKSVENIGNSAFANIDKLNNVTCYAEEVPTTARTAFKNSYTDYATLHVPAVALNDYSTTAPWSGFKTVLPLTEAVYTLTYLVDDNIYKQYEMVYGATITPEPEPVKEGCTFSGWNEIPETMPAHDVTVSGYFTLSYTSWPETVTIKMTVPNGDRTAIGYSSAYGLDFTNVSEVKAWVVTGFTDQAEVLLSRVKIVPPYTGLYLTSDVAGVEVTVPTTEQDIWYANLLLPAVEEETITPTEMKDGEEYTNFVVGKLYSGEMGFVRVTATRTLGPNKSRLLVPSRYYSIPGDSRGGLRVDFIDEQTTDVDGAMRLNNKEEMNNEVYDLQGRRVSQPTKGLYIRGGKKVIIK